jgi:hypothetical protein
MSFSVRNNQNLIITSSATGTNYWSIDGSSNIFNNSPGFVGINKSNPKTQLDISGTTTMNIDQSNSNALIINKNTDGINFTNSQITFTENGTEKCYIWSQTDDAAQSQPEVLRMGSGSGNTSWTIQPISNTGNKIVDKLYYGYPSGSISDLVAIQKRDSASLGDPNIVNLLRISNDGGKRLTLDNSGNLSGFPGTTSMTNGFFYIPAAAGAPSTPSVITGSVPMYYDTSNNFFYIYSSSLWRYKSTIAAP